MDAHDPYRSHDTGEAVVPPSTGLVVHNLAELWSAYRSEGRHLDQALTRLLEELDRQFPIDLLIFTADHGEEFGDHGGMKHGPTVHPEVARVPLWIAGKEALALKKRLLAEGVTATTPVSLTEIGDLILNPTTWSPSRSATVESTVHGPPRFAWIQPDQHFEVAATWLWAQEPSDHIETWLRQHQPKAVHAPKFSHTATDQAPKTHELVEVPWNKVPDELWLDLVDQLSAIFPGRWLFSRSTRSAGLSLPARPSSETRNGWLWGDCQKGDDVLGEVGADAGVCLAFLGSDLEAPFEHLPKKHQWVLQERPSRLPLEGSVSWLEEARGGTYNANVEATLQRLRAMGYLTN